MKVWIVNQYAVAKDQPGGARPFALARELALRGHDVTLVAASFNHWTRTETRLRNGEDERFEDCEGVQILWLRVPPYPGSTVRRFLSMAAFAKAVFFSPSLRSLPPPDVVVGSNPHLFGALAAERIANELGAVFAFELRDIWPQSLVDYGRMSEVHPAIRLLRWIERHLYRSAKVIATLLPASKPYLVSHGADPEGIVWVPNGVYLPDLPAVAPAPSNRPFVIAFVGIHGVANGLGTVLDAAKILRDRGESETLLFRFVGDGGEKPSLVERAQAQGLSNVEFLDPVAKADVPRVIAEADAGLMILKTSPVFRWGVSPNKLFDYFGAGRPVLFSVEAGNNPVAEAGAGISVQADDAEALAAGALELARTSPERLLEMGLAGRAYVESNHDLAKLGGTLEQVLAAAAARAGKVQ
ncbi:MAG: glycosyltransferase family 4 protein [Fimbriimonadaceae bacterium]